MRHVTDGELHAFLDGGLDLLTGDRGLEVRDHLSTCSVCQERLQDEKQVRAQAKTILGHPALDLVALPSFEELRERAEAPGPDTAPARGGPEENSHYRGPLTGIPLAWAATVVLALGVGWMGGQVMSFHPEDSTSLGFERRLESPQQPGLVRADLTELSEAEAEAEDEAGSFSGYQRASPPLTADQPTSPGTVSLLLPTDEVEERQKPIPVQSPAADEALEPELLESADYASGSEETSFAIPGLKIVSTEWDERVPGERALLIRQLLSPADTLELRYFGMLLGSETTLQLQASGRRSAEETPRSGIQPGTLEASLPHGWSQVVMEWGRGLLVARAPIPEANLKALLKTLR